MVRDETDPREGTYRYLAVGLPGPRTILVCTKLFVVMGHTGGAPPKLGTPDRPTLRTKLCNLK
jgi:hypothetical protein